MREREELIEAPKLRAGIAHLSLSFIGRRWRRRRRRRRWLLGIRQSFARFIAGILILRTLGIFASIGRWRTEARSAGYNVQNPSNVRRCSVFVIVLCCRNQKWLKSVIQCRIKNDVVEPRTEKRWAELAVQRSRKRRRRVENGKKKNEWSELFSEDKTT